MKHVLQTYPTIWPEPVRTYLAQTYGAATQIEPLRGLSSATVWRVAFPSGMVVVKAAQKPNERIFYTTFAPTLRTWSIPIPHLELACTMGNTHWLVLEHLPAPLPQTRWTGDDDVLEVLYRLHRGSAGRPLPYAHPFRPAWTASMNASVLALLPDNQEAQLGDWLYTLQTASQPLFTPQCWISGDPNPANWGLRSDGTVALFDWERFSSGTPALDLAITIPGLGEPHAYELVAARYLALGDEASPQAVAALARNIALAKAWSIVEFLHLCHTGLVADLRVLEQLISNIPAWVAAIALYSDSPLPIFHTDPTVV